MIRVGDISMFAPLEAGELLPFRIERERNVKITFNAPQRTVINIITMNPNGTFSEDDPIFLAVVDGLEDVEFYAYGPFAIQADADRIWYRTMDGQDIHAIRHEETFTRIAERRVRDPALEHMQMLIERNQQRRMAPVYEQLEALSRDNERLRAETTVNAGTHTSVVAAPVAESGSHFDLPGAGDPPGGDEGTADDA